MYLALKKSWSVSMPSFDEVTGYAVIFSCRTPHSHDVLLRPPSINLDTSIDNIGAHTDTIRTMAINLPVLCERGFRQ